MMHALDDLGNKTGLETVAEKAGMSPEEVQWVILQNEKMLLIDAPLEIDPMLTIGDAIPDDQHPSPDIQAENSELEILVAEWLGTLEGKQRIVIECRYGFYDQDVDPSGACRHPGFVARMYSPDPTRSAA